jgi:hypothetical protein
MNGAQLIYRGKLRLSFDIPFLDTPFYGASHNQLQPPLTTVMCHLWRGLQNFKFGTRIQLQLVATRRDWMRVPNLKFWSSPKGGWKLVVHITVYKVLKNIILSVRPLYIPLYTRPTYKRYHEYHSNRIFLIRFRQ